MNSGVLYDCEFLTAAGAPQRSLCGPKDADPIIAQIGAVGLSLDDGFEITDTLRSHVTPMGRDGRPMPLDPLFSGLTGLTQEVLEFQAVSVDAAQGALVRFADGARMWC